MTNLPLYFSATSSKENGSYKLIELPLELSKLVESRDDGSTPLRLSVKGQKGEDAVICTSDKTFSVRSVILSNSVLIVTPPSDASSLDFPDDAIVIRDQLYEIFELTPSIPKLHALRQLLKGREYNEEDADTETSDDTGHGAAAYSYHEALRTIQASDAELNRGLKARHILNIQGDLRPIAPSYLHRILELILNALVAFSLPHDAASVEILSSSLANDHEIPRSVSTQLMSWFGDVTDGQWKVDTNALLKEVGLGILRHHSHQPINQSELADRWKTLVGDTFKSSVDLSLLSGNYLVSADDAQSLTYFPASALPVEPAPRFAELFLTRSRWRGDDMTPFLTDIAVDTKEREKLLLKFARVTTDAEGTWYTARAQYHG